MKWDGRRWLLNGKWKQAYRIHLRSRSRGRRRRDDDEEEEATTIYKMFSNVFHMYSSLKGLVEPCSTQAVTQAVQDCLGVSVLRWNLLFAGVKDYQKRRDEERRKKEEAEAMQRLRRGTLVK